MAVHETQRRGFGNSLRGIAAFAGTLPFWHLEMRFTSYVGMIRIQAIHTGDAGSVDTKKGSNVKQTQWSVPEVIRCEVVNPGIDQEDVMSHGIFYHKSQRTTISSPVFTIFIVIHYIILFIIMLS